MRKELRKKSKFLSLVLRHKPEEIGLELDENGWADTTDLLNKTDITFSELTEIVMTNEKKRFQFCTESGGGRIRACQGHSIDVDVEPEEKEPPELLYHGTSSKSVNGIFERGISKVDRQHVHLSTDVKMAKKVGSRHGKPVVLEVMTTKMFEDGNKFYLSKNNVWLVDHVEPKYIRREDEKSEA